jgi:hypothetical protein
VRPTRQVPRLDRRELLGLGGAAALSFAAPSHVGIAALAAERSGAMLAVADPRYDESRNFARGLAQAGAPIIRLAPNAGAAWFEAVAPQMRGGLSLAGLTLDSDFFILERLAEALPMAMRFVGCHDWRCRPGVSHRLRGTMNLEGLVGAIDANGHDWAERLGLALALTPGGGEASQEQWLRREHATPVTVRPSYLVSWLMTVAV